MSAATSSTTMITTLSFPDKAYLLSVANQVLPTLPAILFNILPVHCELDDMLRMLHQEFVYNKLEHCERMFPYMYLNHAYEVTRNQELKPLLDYFKPTKKCLRIAWHNFSHARFHCAEYLPTNILGPHGFDSLDEVDTVLENAFVYRQKEDGLERLKDVRGYINDANIICEAILASFTDDDYYHSGARYMYLRRNVYQPLLSYIEIVHREDVINRFREIFYALKYKQCFRHLLWEKIREPKIRAKYHPSNLEKMLEEHKDLDVDELDALMDQW